jgi:hypothetical protein
MSLDCVEALESCLGFGFRGGCEENGTLCTVKNVKTENTTGAVEAMMLRRIWRIKVIKTKLKLCKIIICKCASLPRRSCAGCLSWSSFLPLWISINGRIKLPHFHFILLCKVKKTMFDIVCVQINANLSFR